MDEAERGRLVAAIAGSLAEVTRSEVVKASVEHFRRADPELGDRIERALAPPERSVD